MEDRLFIGVSMRKTGITSKQTITLCIEDACTEAVQLATFGSTKRAPVFEQKISNPFLVRYEVTKLKIGPEMLNILSSRTKIIAKVTAYEDQERNDLPLNMTYQPVIIWRPGDLAREEKGLQVLNVQVLDETVLADRIFSNPPFKAVFYRDEKILTQQTFHYQRETFKIPLTNQNVNFGHEEFYRCEKGRAYSNLVGQVTVIQITDFGFTVEGQFLNPSEKYHHNQDGLLLMVWCSGNMNMNELSSRDDYNNCRFSQTTDKTARKGPISYAVNTAVPGGVFLASGVDNQCKTGRKINIFVHQGIVPQ